MRARARPPLNIGTMAGTSDGLEYRAALTRLLRDPMNWSRADFTAARAALAHRGRALRTSDLRNAESQASLEDIADELEAAIDTYVRSR